MENDGNDSITDQGFLSIFGNRICFNNHATEPMSITNTQASNMIAISSGQSLGTQIPTVGLLTTINSVTNNPVQTIGTGQGINSFRVIGSLPSTPMIISGAQPIMTPGTLTPINMFNATYLSELTEKVIENKVGTVQKDLNPGKRPIIDLKLLRDSFSPVPVTTISGIYRRLPEPLLSTSDNSILTMTPGNWAINTTSSTEVTNTATVASSSQPRSHPTVVSNRIQIPRLQPHASVILPKTGVTSKTVKVTKTIHVPQTIQIAKTIRVPKTVQVKKVISGPNPTGARTTIHAPRTIQVPQTIMIPKTVMVPKTIEVLEVVEELVTEEVPKVMEKQNVAPVPMMVEISNTDEVSHTVEVTSSDEYTDVDEFMSTEQIFDTVGVPMIMDEPKTVSNVMEVSRAALQTSENTFRPIVLPDAEPSSHKDDDGRKNSPMQEMIDGQQLLEECHRSFNKSQEATPEIVRPEATKAPLSIQIVDPDDVFVKPLPKVYPKATKHTNRPPPVLPKVVRTSALPKSGPKHAVYRTTGTYRPIGTYKTTGKSRTIGKSGNIGRFVTPRTYGTTGKSVTTGTPGTIGRLATTSTSLTTGRFVTPTMSGTSGITSRFVTPNMSGTTRRLATTNMYGTGSKSVKPRTPKATGTAGKKGKSVTLGTSAIIGPSGTSGKPVAPGVPKKTGKYTTPGTTRKNGKSITPGTSGTTGTPTATCKSVTPGITTTIGTFGTACKPVTPGTSVSTCKPVKPGSSVSTSKTATPGTSVSTSKSSTPGTSISTLKPVTPGRSVSTTKPATPGTSISTCKPVTPGTSVTTTKPATPGTTISTCKPVTPGRSVSTSKPSTPSTSVSTCKPVTPGTPVSTCKPITPGTSVSTSKPVTPVRSVSTIAPVTPVSYVSTCKPITPGTPVSTCKPITAGISVSTCKPVTPGTPVSTCKPITPGTSVSTSKPVTPVRSVSTIAPVTPVSYVSTCKPITPGTPVSTCKPITAGISVSTCKPVTPGTSVSTSKPATPGASVSTSKPATPGTSGSTCKPVTPGSSVSTCKPVTPGTSVSICKPVTPGTSVSACKPVTPGASVLTCKPVTPSRSVSTCKPVTPDTSGTATIFVTPGTSGITGKSVTPGASGPTDSEKRKRKMGDDKQETKKKKDTKRQKEIDKLQAQEKILEKAREKAKKQREKDTRKKELQEQREREIARKNQKAVTERLEKEIQQRMMKEIQEHLSRDQNAAPHSDLIERRSYVSPTPGALHITREIKTPATVVSKAEVPERGRKRKAEQDKGLERERQLKQQEESDRERERIRCQMIGKPYFEPIFRGYCCVHNTCQHAGNAASINAVMRQCNASDKALEDAIVLLSLSGADSYYYEKCKNYCTCTFIKEEPSSTSVNPDVTIKAVKKRGGARGGGRGRGRGRGGAGAGNADYRNVMGSKSTKFAHMTGIATNNYYQLGSMEANRVTITPTTAPVSHPPQAVRFKEINPLFSNITEENAKYCNALIIDPSKPKTIIDRPNVTLQPLPGANPYEALLKTVNAATIQVPLNCRSSYYANNNQSNVATISNVTKYTSSGRRELESALIPNAKSGVTIRKTSQGCAGLQGYITSPGNQVAHVYTPAQGFPVQQPGYSQLQRYPIQQGYSQSQGYTAEQGYMSARSFQASNSSMPGSPMNTDFPLLVEIKEEPWSDYEPHTSQDPRYQCFSSGAENSPRKKSRKQQLPGGVDNGEKGAFDGEACFNPNLVIKEEPGTEPIKKKRRRYRKKDCPEVEVRYEYSDGTIEIKQEPLDKHYGYQLPPSISMIPISKSNVDPNAYKYLPDIKPNILTIEPTSTIYPPPFMFPPPVMQPPLNVPVILPPVKKRNRVSIMDGYQIPYQMNMDDLGEVYEMLKTSDLNKFMTKNLLKGVGEPRIKEEKSEYVEVNSEEALDTMMSLMVSNATSGLLRSFKCETFLKDMQKMKKNSEDDLKYFKESLEHIRLMEPIIGESLDKDNVLIDLNSLVSKIEEEHDLTKAVNKSVNDLLKYDGYIKALFEKYLEPHQQHRTPAQSTRSARLNAQKKYGRF